MNPLAIVPDPRIDELEVALAMTLPRADTSVQHLFTPGMYTRECYIPAGSIVTGKIHKTEHPWVLAEGTLVLRDGEGEWSEHVGPEMGVTTPGTRRVLVTVTDCIWITFHANPENLTDPDQIEAQIIHKHDAHLRPQLEGA